MICIISPTVPAIVIGPMDMTLEYSDTLTATFTCTAFGGDGAMLEFPWSTSGASVGSQTETVNADNSTTTSLTTGPLNLNDRGSIITCEVRYSGGTEVDDDTATLYIGIIEKC